MDCVTSVTWRRNIDVTVFQEKGGSVTSSGVSPFRGNPDVSPIPAPTPQAEGLR